VAAATTSATSLPVTAQEAGVPIDSPTQRIVAADAGASCDDACAAQLPSNAWQCDLARLALLNTCAALTKHMNCTDGCHRSKGDDQPALVTPTAPANLGPGKCLFSSGALSCSGSHPKTRRLCFCSPIESSLGDGDVAPGSPNDTDEMNE
jgi:hypothetical protein